MAVSRKRRQQQAAAVPESTKRRAPTSKPLSSLPPPSQRRALRQREIKRATENVRRYPKRSTRANVSGTSEEEDDNVEAEEEEADEEEQDKDVSDENEEEEEADEEDEAVDSDEEEAVSGADASGEASDDGSVEDEESQEEEESDEAEQEEEDEDEEEEAEDDDDESGDDEENDEQEDEEDEDEDSEEADDSDEIEISGAESDEDGDDEESSGRKRTRGARGERSRAQERSRRGARSESEVNGAGKTGSKRAKTGKPALKRGAKGGLDVGAEVMCKWSGNNEEYPARILKRRSSAAALGEPESELVADEDAAEFYVRYMGFDHRLDEWVPKDRIRPAPSGSFPQASAMPSPSPSPSACSGEEGEIHHVKNIHTIELGKYEIETWYYSPYPEEYSKDGKLFLCEFCLKYMKKRHTLERHAEKCDWRHPPGTEIYREGDLSVYEVDGKKQRIYCQNLCLLSKLFLDHKTLYYDVDPFYFYILTECDSDGGHIVGYFSKEKYSPDGYNLACIMSLPPYQRKGYGSFLISLSYELSKREGVVGSPEKPLSDLGRLGYRSYWSRVILSILRDHRGADLSVQDISRMTAISIDDVVDTLKELKLVRHWKGKHVLVVSPKLIDAYLDSTAGKRFRVVDSSKLTYTSRRSGRVNSGESRH